MDAETVKNDSEVQVPPIACRTCGFPCPSGRRGPRGWYCCTQCSSWGRRGIRAVRPGVLECTCRYCESRFESDRLKKYCGIECRLRARDRSRTERPCEICGKVFIAASPRTRFCSKNCIKSHAERRVPSPNRLCRCCGKTFKKKTSSRNAGKYCSRECAFRHSPHFRVKSERKAARAVADGFRYWAQHWRKCCRCDCTFFANTGSRRICTARCKPPKPIVQVLFLRACGCCGQEMVTTSRGQRTCRACRVLNEKQSRKASKHLRRARMKSNGPFERIKPRDVFERDGWRCGLCGRMCNRRATVPNPMAATLDHVVPLSKGGSHTMDNVQCACFACNTRKSDRTCVTSGQGQWHGRSAAWSISDHLEA